MGTNWTTYNGKQILVTDYSGIKQEKELMNVLYSTPSQLNCLPNNAMVLYVVDVSNALMSKKFTLLSQRIENEIFCCFKKKRAIVGMSLIEKIRFLIFNAKSMSQTSFFRTRNEAIEFLTQKQK